MSKSKKVLVILGPTAVGKTEVAIKLAKKFDGELIAADSRQVYCGLDVGSGKYSPGDTFKKFSGKWILNDVAIHGYDLIEPEKQFTAADFTKFFWKIATKIWIKNKLPILVGGTGFYIKAALEGFETLGLPPNLKLRKKLEKLTSEQLFKKLFKLDQQKAENLSPSDRKNPRRLIRAIEVANFLKSRPKIVSTYPYIRKEEVDVLKIGLTVPRGILYQRIDKRVDERIKAGMIEEVAGLLKKGVKVKRLTDFGLEYKYSTDFILGRKDQNKAISELKFAIHDFARRQLTWFMRDPEIIWFDITNGSYFKKVEKQVKKWLNRDRYANKN